MAMRRLATVRKMFCSSVWGRQQGSSTAELAVALPAVLVLLAMLLFAASAGILQLRLEEAAWAAARTAARGEPPAVTTAAARRLAGAGSQVTLSSGPEWVQVRVSAPLDGPFSGLLSWHLTAEAVAQREKPIAPGVRIEPGQRGAGQTPLGQMRPGHKNRVGPAGGVPALAGSPASAGAAGP